MSRGRQAGRRDSDTQRLLSAAMAVMLRDGLDKLSMRAVGDEMDMQAASVYFHVRSKEELLNLMTDHLFAQAADYLQRAVVGTANPTRDLIARAVHYLEFLRWQSGSEQLLSSRRPAGTAYTSLISVFATPLTAHGMPLPAAVALTRAVLAYVHGYLADANAVLSVGPTLASEDGFVDAMRSNYPDDAFATAAADYLRPDNQTLHATLSVIVPALISAAIDSSRDAP